ncbi:hypothetical protein [Variovorax paradoxus]|uniref:hypothetical protein n=1 Tax=Variovorax paradoxus TaxID=34073 RepID=UPI003D661B9F
MPTTISLYLPADYLPDVQTMIRQIRAIEPTFSFEKDFDPARDNGWVPCSIAGKDSGFQWSYEPCKDVRAELQGQHLDFVARASYCSSPADGVCAGLVLGQIAVFSGGVIEKPDGELLDAGDVGEWIRADLNALKTGKQKTVVHTRAAPDADVLLTKALEVLSGARPLRMIFSTTDDPGVTVRFDCGVGIKSRRWTLTLDDFAGLSTRAMPRDMPGSDQRKLKETSDLLTSVLKAGPVRSAMFNKNSLELNLALAGATLMLHPKADSYPTRYDQAFATGDRWEIFVDGAWIYPDIYLDRLDAQWVGR